MYWKDDKWERMGSEKMVEVAVQKKRKANLTRINLILEKCIEIEYMSGS